MPPISTLPIRRTASFDRTSRYRYTLGRHWNDALPRLAMCLLNPSTADHRQDDPTIRRCINFACDWGFGSLEIINIFAYRSTDPANLYQLTDPIGPRNNAAISRAIARANAIVLAWGTHGQHLNRGKYIEQHITTQANHHNIPVSIFARTKRGQPKHPLYLAASSKLITLQRPN